jgi:formate dehydrogenase subunit gamma
MSSEPYLLPKGRVLRYTYVERLVHWLAGVSYVYLMLTGLAFWSPWLFWLAVVLGGATISRELHPWFGVVFVIAVVLMHRMWSRDMRGTPADKEWWAAIGQYARNQDEKMPPTGRFNPGQKLLFWGFVWNSILLLISGLILWLPQYIPWSLRFLRYLAVIVHPVCALLTIGLFMGHVYMGSIIEPESFHSMIRGTVSRAWADQLHHKWFQQILRDAEPRK